MTEIINVNINDQIVPIVDKISSAPDPRFFELIRERNLSLPLTPI